MSARRLTLAVMAALFAASPALAQTIAITGGKVWTGSDRAPADGLTVLVRDGKVAAVGADVAVPAGAKVIDARGKWVTPGVFNAFTRVGLSEVDDVDETNDWTASKAEFSAAVDVVPAIDANHTPIAITRIEGVTRAVVAPVASKSIFGGQGALAHLGDTKSLIFKPQAFQYVELGERGASLAGGSRSASFVAFGNALEEALQYDANRIRYIQGGHRESLVNKLDTEALIPAAKGEMPVLFHVEKASDILQVIALKQRYSRLRPIIVGAAEGWLAADDLARARIPVIAYGLDNLPRDFEKLNATMNNVGRMTGKGVVVALGSPVGDDDARQGRLVIQHAGNMVAQARVPGGNGLSWVQAMQAITVIPARIFGVEAQVGTLEAGKQADVVVWDGDPLELASAPTAVLINGVEQSLESRQTHLRDRYKDLTKPRDLPLDYRW
jgi:imidazolonepropionase-like amidohydrolase